MVETMQLLDRFAARVCPMPSVEDLQARMMATECQAQELRRKRGLLFEMEASADWTLSKEIQRLDCEKERLSKESQLVQAGYKKLSLEPLSWRDAKGFPQFAIFDLNSPTCTFGVRSRRTSRMRSGQIISPESLKKTKLIQCFSDVFATLRQEIAVRKRRRGIQITASYVGVIPDATRQKIFQARQNFCLKIFVISEVDWELKSIPDDPLVTGWDGNDLWLIDQYDTTPAEALIAQAFTQS